jgi:hypothetical protein
VTGSADTKIKSSARWAFQQASAVYLFDQNDQTNPSESVELLNKKFGPVGLQRSLPAYAASDFSQLVKKIKQVHSTNSYVSSRLESGLVRLPRAGAQPGSPAGQPRWGGRVPSLNDGLLTWKPRLVPDQLSTVDGVQGEQS